ncbi:ComEC/Rec2 family competence protein [Micrococcus lacusdianchii]|uniref:ComEC/Rec2 family competence protein n=1 Tax=Micrococcus lacusdianchii TaxID=2915940 RepID=UPI002003AEBA|nr:ComEC/Rec2 family competence protein [Micrococcus sp. JXJ CY 30]
MADRAPAPVDARWVPALLTCLLLGQAAPTWPSGASAVVSVGCLALAAAAGLRLALGRPHPDGRRRGLLTACVLAGAASALLVQHVSLDRAGAEHVGWPQAVADARALRLEVVPTGEPTASDARFGPRWHQPARVERLGHPPRTLAPAVDVVLTGPGTAPTRTPRLCLVGVPEARDGTVFVAAQATPTAGACGTTNPGTDTPTTTGRDALRAALRHAAADGVGTAPQLIPGLVLGDRTAQSPELDQAMKDAGLSHLSAVSGANCALLMGAVTLLLRTLRLPRAAVTAAALGSLAVFVVIVGPEPSVLRAAVMGGLGALAVFLGRGRQAFSLLSAGGTVLLVAAPSLAGEVAFHLSLAATAGIVLAAAPADGWLHGHLVRVLPDVPARWLSSSLAVTVAAHLACQPILLAMTGTVSTWSVPANLVAAPAVAPVTVLGTLAAAVVLPAPALAGALVAVIQWPAAWIGAVALTAADVPGAVRPWPGGALGLSLGVLLTVATLAGFRLVLVLERTPRAPVRRVGRSAPPARDRLPAGGVLTGVLVTAALGTGAAVVVPRPAGVTPEGWALAFCDVGQGDMAVFRSGPASAVVVDAGPDPDAARRCLEDLHVEQVDALLVTHLHADHAAGAAGLSGGLAPAEVRHGAWSGSGGAGREEPGMPPPVGSVPLATGQAGAAGRTGWEVRWEVLLADPRAAEHNDASAQLLVTVEGDGGAVRTLVTGDLEETASAAWAAGRRSDASPPPRVDVLKVAHHGARNGGLDVPEAVGARLHVVSVGADNDYGHPHPVTISGLERLGPVARTDLHGTLALVPASDGSVRAVTVRAPAGAP